MDDDFCDTDHWFLFLRFFTTRKVREFTLTLVATEQHFQKNCSLMYTS